MNTYATIDTGSNEKYFLYLYFILGYAERMRPILFILFISLSLSLFAASKIYKKVNPDGSVEYSDVPLVPGAKPIKLKPLPTVNMTPVAPAHPRSSSHAPATKPFRYESIRILSPQADEAIRSNNGNLRIKGELTPSLQSNLKHHLQWQMDGKILAGANSLNLNLKNLDRGTHKLQLRVLNANGKVVIRTPTISFHILRVALGAGNTLARPLKNAP
ncbi:MAG TPA: DUF4124 domain-containing protein [Gammaproteobacteria bacterium]|nr:DUF4124 domain-containing protein [Gammaproteobacteria bacterium]